MSNERSCPTCGGHLPSDAPEGTCPKCLLVAGFESADGGAGGGTLELDEVARQFPELEIIEELGRGGMGVVYKARQKRLDRFVALKVLPREIAENAPDAARFEDRFTREARALARLSHPNIVAVHEFGERHGMYFFLMEYVDGANLRQTMRTGKLSPTEALAIVPQICDALQFAHEQGVVHRDIKPENVLLDLKGRVKIADFGLAKLVTRAADDRTLTQQGLVMGTPHYMAPEQLEKPSEVDHRADIYSLGVVLYEMLTGELPIGRFAAPSEKVRMDVRLDEIVLRSLEKDANRRYQAVSDVKTGIGEVDLSTPVVGAVAQEQGDPVRPNSRHSKLAFWGLLLPLVAVALGVVLAFLATLFVRGGGGTSPTWRSMPPLLIVSIVVGLTVLVGMGMSVAGMVQIKRSGGKLHGMGLAIAGLLVPLLCCLPGVSVPLMYMSASVAPGPGVVITPVPSSSNPLGPVGPDSVDHGSVENLGEVRVEIELDEGEARFGPRRVCILGLGASAGSVNAHMSTSAETTWPPEPGTLVHFRKLETLRGSGEVRVLLGEERLVSRSFSGETSAPLDVYVRAEHAEFVSVEIEGGARQEVAVLMDIVRADLVPEIAPEAEPTPAVPPPMRVPTPEVPDETAAQRVMRALETGTLVDSVARNASIKVVVPAGAGAERPARFTISDAVTAGAVVTMRSDGSIRWPLPDRHAFRVSSVRLVGDVKLTIRELSLPPEGALPSEFVAHLSGRDYFVAGAEDDVVVEVGAGAAEIVLVGEIIEIPPEEPGPEKIAAARVRVSVPAGVRGVIGLESSPAQGVAVEAASDVAMEWPMSPGQAFIVERVNVARAYVEGEVRVSVGGQTFVLTNTQTGKVFDDLAIRLDASEAQITVEGEPAGAITVRLEGDVVRIVDPEEDDAR